MANPFGEIAANVGKEVAEGLVKKSAPVVKKAVKKVEDTIEGWGFEPKIGQIASTDYIKAQNKLGDYTIEDEMPYRETMQNYHDQMGKELDSGKLIMGNRNKQIERPIDIVAKQFSTLEDMGVPRKYTGKIFNYTDQPDKQEYIANTLKELNPPERDIYMYILDSGRVYPRDIKDFVKYYSDRLTRPEQETFASLMNDWKSSFDDLVEVVKDL